MLFWQWSKMLGIQTLSKQHKQDIKCMHKQIKKSLWSFSASSNGNIISELGIMNMEDYRVVKSKLFCGSISTEGMA